MSHNILIIHNPNGHRNAIELLNRYRSQQALSIIRNTKKAPNSSVPLESRSDVAEYCPAIGFEICKAVVLPSPLLVSTIVVFRADRNDVTIMGKYSFKQHPGTMTMVNFRCSY